MFSEDVLVEILLRLPLIALARCLCVSKLWASIIRNRHFINAYQSRSSTRQPRVMFALPDIFDCWHFFSSSQPPSLVTNATCSIDSTLRMPECVNGLICIEDMNRFWICNPVTGKGVLLPQSAPRKTFTTWYMGYEPINYQYKVLFMSKDCVLCPYEMQVFTLGDQGSWKMIDGGNIHNPATRGICINGVVYYGAHTADGPRVVRFSVATEEFGNFIGIPDEAASDVYCWYFGFYSLENYQGKLALLARKTISIYDLWVLEDVEKQEWSKVSIVITREMCSYDLVWPGVLGFVAGSGEVIVTARNRFYQFHLVYVDLKMKRSIREVLLGGMRSSYQPSMVHAFTDYVESIMLL